VRLPNVPEPVLVVRTRIGFNGTSAICSSSNRTELQYMPDTNMIKCLGCASEFKLDGTVVRGPAKQPLKAYLVDLQGEKLKILG
jgi:Rieske Fe-S protein